MLKFHYHPSPNPAKVALMLEEAGIDYELVPVDTRLAGRRFLVGDTDTIVDMAVWGWARMLPFILGPGVRQAFPNLKRHLDEIGARPAAQRAEALKSPRTPALRRPDCPILTEQ